MTQWPWPTFHACTIDINLYNRVWCSAAVIAVSVKSFMDLVIVLDILYGMHSEPVTLTNISCFSAFDINLCNRVWCCCSSDSLSVKPFMDLVIVLDILYGMQCDTVTLTNISCFSAFDINLCNRVWCSTAEIAVSVKSFMDLVIVLDILYGMHCDPVTLTNISCFSAFDINLCNRVWCCCSSDSLSVKPFMDLVIVLDILYGMHSEPVTLTNISCLYNWHKPMQ